MKSLSDFRQTQEVKPIPKAPKPFFAGSFISIDQTLSKSGWAEVEVSKVGAVPVVTETGMFTTNSEMGFEGSFRRGIALGNHLMDLFVQHTPAVIVHEMPAAGGGMSRPESSLLAGLAVRFAAEEWGIPVVMINVQEVRKHLCGSAKVDKKAVREELIRRDARGLLKLAGAKGPKNNDTYDAIGNAIAALELGVLDGQ